MAKTTTTTPFLGLLCLISLCFLVQVASGYRGLVGGRTKVEDVQSNQEIQQIGRYCVEEYNRTLRGEKVVFSQVVEAERQVVSGIKYYLKIEAICKGLSETFDAVVVVKPWLQSAHLLQFSPSHATK